MGNVTSTSPISVKTSSEIWPVVSRTWPKNWATEKLPSRQSTRIDESCCSPFSPPRLIDESGSVSDSGDLADLATVVAVTVDTIDQ